MFANSLKPSDKVDQFNATLAKQQTLVEDLNTRDLQGEPFSFEMLSGCGSEKLGVG